MNDQLQDLANFLKTKTESTAAYIGKLVYPKLKISDEDDEGAHIDNEAQQIIHFLHATQNHEFLVDKTLKPEQGLTFDVFKEDEPAEEEEERVLEEGEDGYEEQQERLNAKA